MRKLAVRPTLRIKIFAIGAAMILTIGAERPGGITPQNNSAVSPSAGASLPVFNVRDFGATGRKADSARAAIQQAVDACAAAGGGMVYVPPGAYSSGTIHLQSHVRFFVEAGATIYSIKDKNAFDKDALFYGEDLVDVTLEGRGTINGQGAYEWRPKGDFHDDFIYPNQAEMEKIGTPLVRSFPRADQFGKLVLLLRCRDVRIAGLSFIDSPSWTIHPYGCERMVIDGIYIRSSLKEGVWADGIDPDGCKDLRISNCTIETGDDALVFYSMNWFGPAGVIRNVIIRDIIAHGAGMSVINGHPDSPLDGITFENVKLYLAHDPGAPYDKAEYALKFMLAKNLNLKNFEVIWETPLFDQWRSALHFEDIQGLEVENFSGRQAKPDGLAPAVVLNRVNGAMIRNCAAPAGTSEFLRVTGQGTTSIRLFGNDLREAKIPYGLGPGIAPDAVIFLNNLVKEK